MAEQPQSRDELLWTLDPGIFKRREYPGMDALVAIVPKGQEASPDVKRVEGGRESRWFPFDGGWKVVCPFVGQAFDSSVFSVVKNGWDHAHCEGCNATIDIGGSCWTAKAEDDFFVLCDACHAQLGSQNDQEPRS